MVWDLGWRTQPLRSPDRCLRSLPSDPFDSTTVSQDRTEAVFEDGFGNIWIGTPDHGLNKLDRETGRFTRYRHDPEDPRSVSSDAIKAIWEDEDGRLWIGADGGLNVFHRQTETFTRFRHDPNDNRSLSSDALRSIARDTSGLLWIGTRNGLNLFDPATGRAQRFHHDPADSTSLGDDEVARVFVDSRGTLWVGTYDRGVSRYDAVTRTFRHFNHDARDPRSLSHNRVETIYEDRGGVLWFGTVGGGVSRLDLKPRKFYNYTHDPLDPGTITHPTVRSLAIGEDSSVWVGTDGGGLVLLGGDGRTIRRYRSSAFRNSLPNDRIWALLPIGSDSMWVGTYGAGLGLMVTRGGRTRFHRWSAVVGNADSLQDPDIKSLARDHLGTVWVGTTDGLYRTVIRNGDVSFVRLGHDVEDPTSLSGDYINTVYVDAGGFVWIGTLNGLDRLDPRTGDMRHYGADPLDDRALSAPIVTAVLESLTYPGTMWIGTEDGGLNRLDPDSGVVARYLVEDGLPSNVISALVEDHHGHLWLTTSQGLSLFDPTTETLYELHRIRRHTKFELHGQRQFDRERRAHLLRGDRRHDLFRARLRTFQSTRPAGGVDLLPRCSTRISISTARCSRWNASNCRTTETSYPSSLRHSTIRAGQEPIPPPTVRCGPRLDRVGIASLRQLPGPGSRAIRLLGAWIQQ